jgi:hypothetical protein
VRGDATPEAEVASILFAEFLLLNRAYLKAKFKKREDRSEVVRTG